MPEKDQLAAIRHWLLENHAAFRAILNKPAVRKTFKEFEGEALTRPPKGFPCDHPAIDLIKCKQWGLSTTLPAETALEPNFALAVIKHFKLLAPMVDALNTPIAASLGAQEKGSFRPELAPLLGLLQSASNCVPARYRASRKPAKPAKIRQLLGKIVAKTPKNLWKSAFSG